jgi:hypothetical protein
VVAGHAGSARSAEPHTHMYGFVEEATRRCLSLPCDNTTYGAAPRGGAEREREREALRNRNPRRLSCTPMDPHFPDDGKRSTGPRRAGIVPVCGNGNRPPTARNQFMSVHRLEPTTSTILLPKSTVRIS